MARIPSTKSTVQPARRRLWVQQLEQRISLSANPISADTIGPFMFDLQGLGVLEGEFVHIDASGAIDGRSTGSLLLFGSPAGWGNVSPNSLEIETITPPEVSLPEAGGGWTPPSIEPEPPAASDVPRPSESTAPVEDEAGPSGTDADDRSDQDQMFDVPLPTVLSRAEDSRIDQLPEATPTWGREVSFAVAASAPHPTDLNNSTWRASSALPGEAKAATDLRTVSNAAATATDTAATSAATGEKGGRDRFTANANSAPSEPASQNYDSSQDSLPPDTDNPDASNPRPDQRSADLQLRPAEFLPAGQITADAASLARDQAFADWVFADWGRRDRWWPAPLLAAAAVTESLRRRRVRE